MILVGLSLLTRNWGILVRSGHGWEEEEKKVQVCHRPPGNPSNVHIQTINQSALDTHLAHGDNVVLDQEVCNGVDDDCDGIIDNHLDLGTCTVGTGVCAQTGSRNCTAGTIACGVGVNTACEECQTQCVSSASCVAVCEARKTACLADCEQLPAGIERINCQAMSCFAPYSAHCLPSAALTDPTARALGVCVESAFR